MRSKARWLIGSVCFLGWATVVVPDETSGVGTLESVHYNRGIDWYAKNELDKAISEFNEAIRLDPASASAYCSRALAWYDSKRSWTEIQMSTERRRVRSGVK
jgi:tetratricopeptide (TPR) repeat protein